MTESKTPRTDAECKGMMVLAENQAFFQHIIDHARALELELAAKQKELDSMTESAQHYAFETAKYGKQADESMLRLSSAEKELVWNCSMSDKVQEIRALIEGYLDGAPDASTTSHLANRIDDILGQSVSPQIIQKHLQSLTQWQAVAGELAKQLEKRFYCKSNTIELLEALAHYNQLKGVK